MMQGPSFDQSFTTVTTDLREILGIIIQCKDKLIFTIDRATCYKPSIWRYQADRSSRTEIQPDRY